MIPPDGPLSNPQPRAAIGPGVQGRRTNAVWASPEGMKLRLDLSAQIGERTGDNVEPRDLIHVVAGDAVTSETKRAIELAESRKQAMALLLMSPEFQRR